MCKWSTMVSALLVVCMAQISAASNLDACSAGDGSCPVNHANPSGTLAMQVKVAAHDSQDNNVEPDVPDGWKAHKNLHCGGDDIKQWEDGTDAKYGPRNGPNTTDGAKTDLEDCRRICAENSNICKGFVQRWGGQHADNICSFWKQGSLKMKKKKGHTCWEITGGDDRKDGGDFFAELAKGWHCGGKQIKNKWDNGQRSNYGNTVDKKWQSLDECKNECLAHTECAAFVHRREEATGGHGPSCAFWKRGPLEPYEKPGHDCYKRIES